MTKRRRGKPQDGVETTGLRIKGRKDKNIGRHIRLPTVQNLIQVPFSLRSERDGGILVRGDP